MDSFDDFRHFNDSCLAASVAVCALSSRPAKHSLTLHSSQSAAALRPWQGGTLVVGGSRHAALAHEVLERHAVDDTLDLPSISLMSDLQMIGSSASSRHEVDLVLLNAGDSDFLEL